MESLELLFRLLEDEPFEALEFDDEASDMTEELWPLAEMILFELAMVTALLLAGGHFEATSDCIWPSELSECAVLLVDDSCDPTVEELKVDVTEPVADTVLEIPGVLEAAVLASTARDGYRLGNRLEYEEHEVVPAVSGKLFADGWPIVQWDGYPMFGTPTRDKLKNCVLDNLYIADILDRFG